MSTTTGEKAAGVYVNEQIIVSWRLAVGEVGYVKEGGDRMTRT